MILRLAVLVAVFLAIAGPSANAQRLAAPFPVAHASAHLPTPTQGGLLGPSDRDHRYTGFYVGLGAGAALGVYGIAECGSHACAVQPLPFAVLSMFVFSITGALIGGLIPK